MRAFIPLVCLLGLAACSDPSPDPVDPRPPAPEGEVLRAAAAQIGAVLSVDTQHTQHAGVASGSVVSTNPNGRLVAVIVD